MWGPLGPWGQGHVSSVSRDSGNLGVRDTQGQQDGQGQQDVPQTASTLHQRGGSQKPEAQRTSGKNASAQLAALAEPAQEGEAPAQTAHLRPPGGSWGLRAGGQGSPAGPPSGRRAPGPPFSLPCRRRPVGHVCLGHSEGRHVLHRQPGPAQARSDLRVPGGGREPGGLRGAQQPLHHCVR